MQNRISKQNQAELQRECEKGVCKIIQINFYYEEKLEAMRKNLSSTPRFSIVAIFYKISRGKEYITKEDIRSFFAANHHTVRERECDFLVFDFRKSDQTYLILSEFASIFAPKTDENLANMIQQQCDAITQSGEQQQYFEEVAYFIEAMIIKYLELELQLFRELEAEKTHFANRFGSFLLQAFADIYRGSRAQGYDMIHWLMKRNGFSFSKDNFNYLMNRIDRDGNGLITIDEFLNEKFVLPSFTFARYASEQASLNAKKFKQSTRIVGSLPNSVSNGFRQNRGSFGLSGKEYDYQQYQQQQQHYSSQPQQFQQSNNGIMEDNQSMGQLQSQNISTRVYLPVHSQSTKSLRNPHHRQEHSGYANSFRSEKERSSNGEAISGHQKQSQQNFQFQQAQPPHQNQQQLFYPQQQNQGLSNHQYRQQGIQGGINQQIHNYQQQPQHQQYDNHGYLATSNNHNDIIGFDSADEGINPIPIQISSKSKIAFQSATKQLH